MLLTLQSKVTALKQVKKINFTSIFREKKSEKVKSEADFFEEQQEFQEKHKDELKHYGMLSKPADSKK